MIFLFTEFDTHGGVYSAHSKKLGKEGEKNGKSKNQN